ncbi:hypothetical protein [uncultured Draconibacterium sp.]|uniref:hypothetical protein n=1 Tax=uncultured Draconibacterium sp. TaxID=1573823 RepID=UPI0032602B78
MQDQEATVPPEVRNEFLIKRYEVLWGNIDRSMNGIWNILATITIVGTMVFAVESGKMPGPFGKTVGFIVIFWALNIALDLNAWHQRNLAFLTAIERAFLKDGDYGRIIPKSYRTPKSTSLVTFYVINVLTFSFLLIAFSVWSMVPRSSGGCWGWGGAPDRCPGAYWCGDHGCEWHQPASLLQRALR